MIYAGIISNPKINEELFDKTRKVISQYVYATSEFEKSKVRLFFGKENEKNDMDYLLSNDNNIVLGRIIDSYSYENLTQEKFSKLSIDTLDDFNDAFWGKYIVININELENKISITRDISGQLPIFYAKHQENYLVFSSHIEILAKICNLEPNPNIHVLSSYILYNGIHGQSVFDNILEVMTEFSLSIDLNNNLSIRRCISFPKGRQIRGLDGQYPVLTTMQKSIKAWIQPYENIYLSLSGGLDSTSLLFCLKEVLNDNQKLVALNLYHSDFFASCEREYAEKACREAGVSLIKLESSDDLPFSPRQFDLKLLPNKPCMALIGLALQESMYLQMDANKKCIMLSGQGGDHVFMRPPTMLSLTDCILRKKFNIVFKKLFELAHFYREPFFVIIKKNIEECISLDKKRRMVALSYHEQKKPEWFNDRYSMIDESIIDEHWKRFSSIKEPGKKEHIHAILSALSTIEQEWIDTSNPCFFPFLSKPLIDYASKLNTFDLYSFGYDRYQIRKEVSQRYKTNLVWRRDKGETSGMTQLGFRKNLSKINELCLEGYFAQHNLLDKNILHKSILACSNGFKENMNFLINLITAEMFIDGWRSKMKTN